MAVVIKLVGDNDNSDEYFAALRLKKIFEESLPKTASGDIVIVPNVTLFGQAVKDVDIMMVGELNNCPVDVYVKDDDDYKLARVYINSFCTTIEVKSHPASKIVRRGTDFLVPYKNQQQLHNATHQSNEQKKSAMSYFRHALGSAPYITNFLWFIEITNEELDTVLGFKSNNMISNVLPGMFRFEDMAQLFMYQKSPYFSNNRLSFDSNFAGRDTNSISNTLGYFAKAREGMGQLTRQKIEQISRDEFNLEILDNEHFRILRGRAGTGKTINLLQAGIRLVDEEYARVLILTYNRALVSDIRRLLALAKLPDMFEEKCINICTMQSFFYNLINSCLYDGKLDGIDYLRRYDELLKEFIAFLNEDDLAFEVLKDICVNDPSLNWEYILIDEAQDWSNYERDVILMLYDKTHVIVADGGRQFVRNVETCDWTVVPQKKNIKLKECLRQKNNLIKFVNNYARLLDDNSNSIVGSNKMPGGKIIVLKDRSKLFSVLKTELNDLKKAGNSAYDMLLLTPSSLVDRDGDDKHFSLLRDFEFNNILLWDGTNDDNRLEYAIDSASSRVFQYDSARGLEGWTVCCLDFDDFMEQKEKMFNPEQSEDKLLLESIDERKAKYLLNWALIPLTRAIDTLIITFKDENSKYSKAVLSIADQSGDYVTEL